MKNEFTSDPLSHTANVKKLFQELQQHLRDDILKINDPAAKALFETAAVVLSGLEKAFTDYELKSEPAWQ
jgi:hypothetical protein